MRGRAARGPSGGLASQHVFGVAAVYSGCLVVRDSVLHRGLRLEHYAALALSPAVLDEKANEPGDPICCEVCAQQGTADQACDAVCNWLACDRARDEHVAMANDLGTCVFSDCGFDFEFCMSVEGLHPQLIIIGEEFVGSYALEAHCNAHAMDPARPDGLFEYLEQLDGVPSARGSTADVTDVVQWCLDRLAGSTGEGGTGVISGGEVGSGADTTAGGMGAGGSDGGPPSPPPRCGPWAMQRNAANPTHNFGIWSAKSNGMGADSVSSYPVTITGGAVEYSVLPCEGVTECIRLDRLTVTLVESGGPLELALNLLERTPLMPIGAAGVVDVPVGVLHFGIRYEWEHTDRLVYASNTNSAQIRVDLDHGEVELLDVIASSDTGEFMANLSLYGDLVNTQPRPKILVAPGSSPNSVVLTAQTIDAESDPISHHWMVLGEGAWIGDSVEVSLPAGRHPVVLYAQDVHEARGVAATWVEVAEGGVL